MKKYVLLCALTLVSQVSLAAGASFAHSTQEVTYFDQATSPTGPRPIGLAAAKVQLNAEADSVCQGQGGVAEIAWVFQTLPKIHNSYIPKHYTVQAIFNCAND